MASFLWPFTNLHELNLDWIIQTVKNLAAEWAQVQQDWTDEQQAFEDLKEYVMDYFKNLDVQDEINGKINSMLEDGSLESIISDIFQGSTSPIFVTSPGEMTDHSKQYVLTTDPDGHIYFWDGSNFAESDVLFGNTNGVLKYIQFINNRNDPVDFDALTTYGNYWVYLVPDGQPINNAPADYTRGTSSLIVLGYDPTDQPLSFVVQILITAPGSQSPSTVYYRSKIDKQEWNDWTSSRDIPTNYAYRGVASSSSAALDFNTFTNYGNYWVSMLPTNPVNNAPGDFNSGTGTLLVYGYNPDGEPLNYAVQILVGSSLGKFYTRFLTNGIWSDWQKILIEGFSDDYIKSVIKETPKVFTPDFGGVLEFMAVGDSLTDGYTADETKVVSRCRNHSWPAFVARKYGITAHWAAKAGVTAKTWLTDPDCLSVLTGTPAQTMYFVSLCTNDASDVEETPLGTVADCGTNANSFYAYYYKVLQAIRSHAPNAFIFTTGSPVGQRSRAHSLGFETAIREVTGKFDNAAFLDTYNVINESVVDYSSDIAGHYTSVGYSILASIYNDAIASYLAENPALNIAAPEITRNPE